MVVRRGVCFLASTLEKPDITVKVDDNVNNIEYGHTDSLVILSLYWGKALSGSYSVGEQPGVEGGDGQAENCSCRQSHWGDQVMA